jgi:hypothetical protein
MATTFSGNVASKAGWTWIDHVGQAPVVDSNEHQYEKEFTHGVNPYQANAVWHAEFQVLAPGQTRLVELDLLQPALFGDLITIPLAKVKVLQVINRNTEGDGYLLVGGAQEHAWAEPFGSATDRVKVMPDSPLLLVNARNGWQVPDGASVLAIQAIGGSVTFDIVIIGILAENPPPST